MPFGVNNFGKDSKGFDNGLAKGFKTFGEKEPTGFKSFDNPFKFTPGNDDLKSRIRFYDRDSRWSRWRRGYELYTITQSVLGSFAEERSRYGDFRMYCAYQLFPGVFIPARVFTFPTSDSEINEQLVGIRDANGFNFYNFGLSILAVRYLKVSKSGTYVQSGTTLTISIDNHGFSVGDSVCLVFNSGSAQNATLTISAVTVNTFVCMVASALDTSGDVDIKTNTTFEDPDWNETRVKLRSIFPPIPFLINERLVDRVVEKDPGVFSSYTRSGVTVTVNCTQPHGLATGNTIFAVVLGGGVTSKQYKVTVISPTRLQFTTTDSGVTGGTLIVNRLIPGFNYEDYVGYTMTGVDYTTKELLFQRESSYGAKLDPRTNKPVTTVPAERGFEVGRFLTTEMRYQCTCQDYMRRSGYNLYQESTNCKLPVTPITSVKPGERLNKDNSITEERDDPGVYHDLGYITVTDGFYDLPDYKDRKSTSYPNLQYYQLRWCKHVYAALFSINHDEGNIPILGKGTYQQSGPNITVSIVDHGLAANGKIQINFTSGSAISGEYIVTEVIDPNTFKIVYPFSNATNGYCSITNIRRHQFIEAWLLEPSDKPAGDDLDTFYKNFNAENSRLRQSAERLLMMKQGMKWVGSKTISGAANLPTQVANYDPNLVTMMMTDDIRRSNGTLDRAGILQNSTQRMSAMMSKLLNVEPSQILGEQFGMLDQPLYNYDTTYQYGLLNGGRYLNGKPYSDLAASTTTPNTVTEDANTVTVLDCLTYNPVVPQEFTVDAGPYS
jgi:hypothetical protein